MLRMASLNWFKTDAQGSSFWSNSSCNTFERRNGCALLFSKSSPVQHLTDVTPLDLPEIAQNRYLVVKGNLDGIVIYIHVLYALTGDDPRKAEFFTALPTDFDGNSRHIICGDFNLVLNPTLDKVVHSHRRPTGLDALERWMSSLGVVDSWRLLNPDSRKHLFRLQNFQVQFKLARNTRLLSRTDFSGAPCWRLYTRSTFQENA
ncbi:hypothetical protein H257_08149 [Aphanomyces astaci]|uniref:Endonuclease/exonuclease/phosphatase domain-containing protein n=1 Tax=Aphanomyces astaci TaxID=112090 RepID=W4GDY5_APHAT|nr:hypothetical protein H257_08149 [Aphanomyces astaci]ETV77902.1 hypothetical protein H257_08149 [Aphanomyces astaci]|eukprot:XP_009832239.1 hypothetical protein H257_08149 [Aphanomyces astaci]